MVYVEVVTAVGFGEIFVSAAQVPLAASDASVISRSRDSEHSTHGQDPAADVLIVEVAAEADLLQLNFVRAENLGRSTQRVILGVIEAADEVTVKTNFRSEEFGIPHRVFVASLAIEPSPVGEREGSEGAGFRVSQCAESTAVSATAAGAGVATRNASAAFSGLSTLADDSPSEACRPFNCCSSISSCSMRNLTAASSFSSVSGASGAGAGAAVGAGVDRSEDRFASGSCKAATFAGASAGAWLWA